MGREQGDDLGTEVDYVSPDHPEWGARPAYTPADEVNLKARGWVVKHENKPAPQAQPAQTQPTKAPAQTAPAQQLTGTSTSGSETDNVGTPEQQKQAQTAAVQKPAGSYAAENNEEGEHSR